MRHGVVRPPSYCCHSSIELAWEQVKSYIVERNSTFSIADVERFTQEAVDSIPTSTWANCVRHAKRLQKEYFDREISMDPVIDPFIASLPESHSDPLYESASESDDVAWLK